MVELTYGSKCVANEANFFRVPVKLWDLFGLWDETDGQRQNAIQCRDKLEQETQKPYDVTNVAPAIVPEMAPVDGGFGVTQFSDCYDGAVFEVNAQGSLNPLDALHCSEALNRIAGKEYTVKVAGPFERTALFGNTFFVNQYTVQSSEE